MAEMLAGFSGADVSDAPVTARMANFAGKLADRTIVSGKEDFRENIFGQSLSWFMDGGELALGLESKKKKSSGRKRR